jgi:hypothetical protein
MLGLRFFACERCETVYANPPDPPRCARCEVALQEITDRLQDDAYFVPPR